MEECWNIRTILDGTTVFPPEDPFEYIVYDANRSISTTIVTT